MIYFDFERFRDFGIDVLFWPIYFVKVIWGYNVFRVLKNFAKIRFLGGYIENRVRPDFGPKLPKIAQNRQKWLKSPNFRKN